MDQKDANIPCACGSGLKFKKCYGKQRPDCPIFLMENREILLQKHPKKEKEVIDFLTQASSEVGMLFFGKDCGKIVGARMQLVCAFTLADVFSNYWDLYLPPSAHTGSRGSNDKFRNWAEKFCFTDANKTFTEKREFAMGAEPMLDLRHSLMHFLGLSPQDKGIKIVLATNSVPPEIMEKYKKGFGQSTVVLQPVNFYDLFRDAGILMLQAMGKNIEDSKDNDSAKWEHIEGVHRIFEKFQLEGAKQITIDKN